MTRPLHSAHVLHLVTKSLTKGTATMIEIQMFMLYLHELRQSLTEGRRRDERGAVTPEQVVLTAIFAAGAIAIGGIIVAKFTGAANSIPTGP